METILITGGAGYVGAVLTPKLLDLGYRVKVIDLMIYGENVIAEHVNLEMTKGDIRDQSLLSKLLVGVDYVIHLACISNDPSLDLNPELGRSINLDAFEPLVKLSQKEGVKRFVYASSSSVYGVKDVENVSEDIVLEPLTDYSVFKADCEIILANYTSDDFVTVTIRPATVCGYSPRQRLDVVVNILTNFAYHKGSIKVFGGEQLLKSCLILCEDKSHYAKQKLVTCRFYFAHILVRYQSLFCVITESDSAEYMAEIINQ